jgi:hypothetical protein
MDKREGRGVLLYVLLDVGSDEEATSVAERLGEAMADVDDRFAGYAVSSVERVELTFEAEGSTGENQRDGSAR